MGIEKNIVTQAAVDPIKSWESTLTENLSTHANSTLSKAHGMEFVYSTHPFYDGYGNDLSVYADSNGDVVGTETMRLSYNNTNYYVPLQSSALDPQPPLTGISTTASTVDLGQGDTAWVTDFANTAQATLISTNNALLVPHTQKGHWEAHTGGIYSIQPQIVLDSAGHRVSNYVAKIIYESNHLLIPCDTRRGGPIQVARNAVIAPNSIAWSFPGGTGYTGGTTCKATWLGTAPFTIRWALLGPSNQWNYLTKPDGTPVDDPVPLQESYDLRLHIRGSCTLGNFSSVFTFLDVGTQKGNNVGQMRVEITNSAGTAYAYANLSAHDDTDTCIAFSAGFEVGLLPFSDFQTALHYRMRLMKSEDMGNPFWGGYLLAAQYMRQHITQKTLPGRIFCRLLHYTAQGMRWKMGKGVFSWKGALSLKAMKTLAVAIYMLFRKRCDAQIARWSSFSVMKLYHGRLSQIRAARRLKE